MALPTGGAELIEELGAAVADNIPEGKEGGLWRTFRSCLSYLLPIVPIAYLVLWHAGYL